MSRRSFPMADATLRIKGGVGIDGHELGGALIPPSLESPPDALSYVHGSSTLPLIGDTIGVVFDRTVARFGDREALVVRHQKMRWTYRELKQRVDDLAGGLLALGLKPGDRIGIWSPNNCRVGADPVRHGQGRADPGQHQPGLSPHRAGIRAEQGRLHGADHCAAFKTSDYLGMVRDAGAGAGPRRAGQRSTRQAAEPARS